MPLAKPKQYPGQHLLIVWGGTLFATEQWSCSLRMGNPSLPSPVWNWPTTVPQAIIDAIQAFHLASSVTTAAAKLTFIKANPIDTDGSYVSETSSTRHDFATPVAPTLGTTMPAQVALAATLQTDAQRGLASKGRFYIPSPGVAIGGDGRISDANAVTVANHVAALVNSLNAWGVPAHDIRVCVASGGKQDTAGNTTGPGAIRPVTSVGVGRVLDVQRRRREDLVEAYQKNTTAITP